MKNKNLKNLKQKILSVTKIIILSSMVAVSGGDLLATHWNNPSWSSSNIWYTSPYPWTRSSFPLPPPNPQAKNVDLPINISDSPQIKNGPLHLDIHTIVATPVTNQLFGLTIPYKGILIGNRHSSTIQSTPGLLHFYKDIANPQQSAIRVEEQGVALVTDSPDVRIGIGTLNPQYTIDIPDANSVVRIGGNNFPVPGGVSLQTLGRMKIIGGNPFPGAFLASLDYEGEAIWVNTPTQQAPYTFHKSLVNFTSTEGVSTTITEPLQPGLWQVTVWGTTGNTCDSCSKTTRVRMFWAGPGGNPFSEDILFETRDNPDGTDPFSVTRIIRIWHNQFNISVSNLNNASPATPPLINGITAIWLGQ